MTRARLWTLLGAAAAVLGLAARAPESAAADEPTIGRFPVVVHVGVRDGVPVADDAYLAERIAVANRHFAPAGLCFEVEETRLLADGRFELETFRDRRRLGRSAVPRKINVFVFDRILDPVPSAATVRAASRVGGEPSGFLGGAHVPWPGSTPATYLIVARSSSALTITHELGHFFGAPHHRDPSNIMSYGADRTAFDARQLATFRASARRHARRALRPVEPAGGP